MSISVSGDNELCFGAEYIMSLLAYGGAGDYQFEWTYEEDPILGVKTSFNYQMVNTEL